MTLISRVLFILLTILSMHAAAQEQTRVKNYNVDKGLALDGYDPVSYFNGGPTEGKKQFALTHKSITYYFSSAANRSAFVASPDKFEPAYGGWCAYAMGESGEKVKVDPETYKIIAGKLYLFYNFWGNNTLEDWNKNETKLKASADQQWKKYVKP